MAEIRSLTRNQNYDNDSGAPWSDLNHDVLFLVMMKLGVIDFVSFSGVCKSWRSLAVPNRKMFMASKPPISISISSHANEKELYLNLEDFEGRKFKTLIPHSAGRTCIGLTCGYMIFIGDETHDLWLVNPITRHQLHFPHIPSHVYPSPTYMGIRAILVFLPSVSEWLLAITQIFDNYVCFSVAGKGVWNHVSTTSCIIDLHAFKGKIYTLNIDDDTGDARHLCELKLGPEPKLTLFQIKNFPENSEFHPEFLSLDENLHLVEYISGGSYKVHQLHFGEMKWVYCDKTKEEYVFYCSNMDDSTTAIKKEPCAGTDKSGVGRLINNTYMWYFPHDCLNVNLMDES